MQLSLKEILGLDFDSRKNYRFDVSKLPGIYLKINDQNFEINDMSLSGLSFFNNDMEILPGEEFESYICISNNEVRVVLKLISKKDGRHGCELSQNINQYELFFQQHLSQLTPQQY